MRLESEEEASFFLPDLVWTHRLSRTYPSARSAELALSARIGHSLNKRQSCFSMRLKSIGRMCVRLHLHEVVFSTEACVRQWLARRGRPIRRQLLL
jgi:hypothetical protein